MWGDIIANHCLFSSIFYSVVYCFSLLWRGFWK